MRISKGDLDDPRVIELLAVHLRLAFANTARDSAHALDVDGLRALEIEFCALWDGEELLAVGALKAISPEQGEVKSMHVAQAQRRRGAGSILLRHLIGRARKKAMRRVSLETGSRDYFAPARALYRKHGFSTCPPFGDYKPDPNSVFMSLDLQTKWPP